MAVVAIGVVYVGQLVLAAAAALCLATGLYYLAELVEEHIRTTRRVLAGVIKATIGLNALLCVVDGMPASCTLTGILAQLTYRQLLKDFPFIACSDVRFIASAGMLVINHCLWMHHLLDTHMPVEAIFAFFLLTVWLVPFGFMISLAATDSMLPGGAHGANLHKMNEASSKGGKGARTILRQGFSFLQAQRNAVLPQAAPEGFPQPTGLDHSHKA
mmetsp:Transcript_17385/g.43723  ORF Transcript_17385/g.43723 Transcript_17385/m.43723 type:complete len:215 (-) Transcript_17385:341-985(-)